MNSNGYSAPISKMVFHYGPTQTFYRVMGTVPALVLGQDERCRRDILLQLYHVARLQVAPQLFWLHIRILRGDNVSQKRPLLASNEENPA
jgi:hypothetical protein